MGKVCFVSWGIRRLDNLFIYQARESWLELWWGFSALLAWRKRELQTNPSLILHTFFALSFFCRQETQRSPTLVPPSQQRHYKSQFLQKLSYQKCCWDKARISSLVDKQVDVRLALMLDQLCGQSLHALSTCFIAVDD